MRLSEATLARISPGIRRFGYDRAAQATGIVHFGIGAFHRAHQAWYTDLAMEGGDREIGEGFYRVVSEVAPELMPKTYYGMPAFANAEGKVVVFMQPSVKFKARYSTIGFEDRAALDDGEMWPTSFAVLAWTPAVEARLRELVASAIG